MSSFGTTQFFIHGQVNFIVSLVASCHNLGLLLFHIYVILCSKQEISSNVYRTQYLSVFSIIMMTVFPISVLCLYIIEMNHVGNLDCQLQIQIGIITYLCSKFALYILLLERLFIIFRNSQYKLNKNLIWIIRLIIGSLFLVSMTLVMVNKISQIDAKDVCLTTVPMLFKAVFIFIDLSVSMFVLILFSRKLLFLSLNMSNNLNKTKPATPRHPSGRSLNYSLSFYSAKIVTQNLDESLLKVMRKTNLLGIIAILTTQFSLIISTFFPGNLWTIIDSMANCWCILLMFQHYNKIFDCLCQCLLCFISDECLTICACYFGHCCMNEIEENIQVEMVDSDSHGTKTCGTATGSSASKKLTIDIPHHINVSSNTIDEIYEAVPTPETDVNMDNENVKNDNENSTNCMEISNIHHTTHRNSTHL
eukprot:542438_1